MTHMCNYIYVYLYMYVLGGERDGIDNEIEENEKPHNRLVFK